MLCPGENSRSGTRGSRPRHWNLLDLRWAALGWGRLHAGPEPTASLYNGPNSGEETKKVLDFHSKPSTPVKCAGAPQKILYLLEDQYSCFLKKHPQTAHEIPPIQFKFYSGMGKLFAIEKYAKALQQICDSRGIERHLNHDLAQVDVPRKQAYFKTSDPDALVKVDYDMLHVVPPMAPPPPWIQEAGLGNKTGGWVDVDPQTTQHLKYPNIFSLGDASSLPTSKTAAAVAAQVGVT